MIINHADIFAQSSRVYDLPHSIFWGKHGDKPFFYKNQTVPIKTTSVLIVGDSHTQRSLNPKCFNDAQNISQLAEPYFLTYWKLKKIFKSYIPDTLIIGFAPHNISEFNDLKLSNKKWSKEMFKRSYPIQEFKNISHQISVDYWTCYKVSWKQTALYPKRNHINYIGNYLSSHGSNTDNFEKVIKRHYYQNGIELGISKLAVNYLDSIVSLCNLNKIYLVMVSSPVHEKYLKGIPTVIMEKYRDLTKIYSAKHNVFNQTTNFYPDPLYLDPDHLNNKGAKKFTMELIEYLK